MCFSGYNVILKIKLESHSWVLAVRLCSFLPATRTEYGFQAWIQKLTSRNEVRSGNGAGLLGSSLKKEYSVLRQASYIFSDCLAGSAAEDSQPLRAYAQVLLTTGWRE